MAKVFRVYDHKSKEIQWIPATSTCQSKDDAAKKVGCEPGVTCTVTTRFSGDLTAQEYIAQQKAGETPAPTTTTTTKTTGKTPTPTTTTPTTTTPTTTPSTTAPAYPTSSTGFRELTESEKSQWTGVTDWDVMLSYRPDTGNQVIRMTGNYADILYQLEMQGEYPRWIKPAQEYYDEYEFYRQFFEQNPDWPDVDIQTYFANRQTFLDAFEAGVPPGEVATAKAGFTDEQTREYNEWWDWYNRYGETGEWKPVSIEDFYNNYDKAMASQDILKQRGAEAEEYEISEAEAARRREEAYAESRYAAQERYGETPMYSEAFAGWLPKAATEMSGALREYVESEYPSLRAQYEATQPRLTGYATREEARAEAARRETGFQSWLTGEMPTTYQQYMSQRPYARGERYAEYSPTMRFVNW